MPRSTRKRVAELRRARIGLVMVTALWLVPSCRLAAPADPPVEIVVDAHTRVGRVRPIWDEVNLWKLHSLFGVQHVDPGEWWGRGWMRRHLPWVRYGRVLAALGGNYAPAIAPWCDHGIAAPEHPDTGTGECGHDGTPGSAAVNELVRSVDGKSVIDYTPFRTAIERLLASGIRPHLNLSSAPTAFTGNAADFSHYHWNAEPVRDFDAWGRFVAGAFAAVADLDTRGWRVSIVNEPNCLTMTGWEQHIRHVGFAGTPTDYGRIFALTAATVRRAAPGARIHAGNYVTSATFPGEDNLAPYLTALGTELGAGADVTWADLAAVSLSLYETPDTSVYEFVPVRLARLEAAERAAGLTPKPVKIDELEIHPVIVERFNARAEQRLETTLFAASWHAEALRSFIAAGNVVSVAPWLDRLVDVHSWREYPKMRTYQLFGLLAGQLRDAVADDGSVVPTLTARRGGLARLAVSGEVGPPVETPHLYPARARSVGALATRAGDVLRVLVVQHQNEPLPDAARQWRRARDVRIVARGLSRGAYAVRHLSIGGPGGSVWDGTDTTPLRWIDDGCRVAEHGVVTIDPGRTVGANTVWLFEARRQRRCATAPSVQPTDGAVSPHATGAERAPG